MRISDWSSDVCSSDLGRGGRAPRRGPRRKGRWHRLAGAFLPKIACGGPNSRTRQAFGRNPFLGSFLGDGGRAGVRRSEEHTSELQSLMRISYAVFCLNKKIYDIKKKKTK